VSREPLLRAHRNLAAVIAGLILVMAAIAGRSIFGPWDIEVHGWVGNGVFVLAVVSFALAIYRRPSTAELTVAALIGMLTFGQVGLGYVGREQLEAAAWHIPNGVLLMALSTYQWATLQAGVAASASR
jgi:hypothetical protein